MLLTSTQVVNFKSILRCLSLLRVVLLEKVVWHREPLTRETLHLYMAQYRHSHMDLQELHRPLDQHSKQRADLSSPKQLMFQDDMLYTDLSPHDSTHQASYGSQQTCSTYGSTQQATYGSGQAPEAYGSTQPVTYGSVQTSTAYGSTQQAAQEFG